MAYYIPKNISSEYLISHYGFKEVPYFDKVNLEYRDDMMCGLRIWWKDRSVDILLGLHAECGVAPIPQILFKLIQKGIIQERK